MVILILFTWVYLVLEKQVMDPFGTCVQCDGDSIWTNHFGDSVHKKRFFEFVIEKPAYEVIIFDVLHFQVWKKDDGCFNIEFGLTNVQNGIVDTTRVGIFNYDVYFWSKMYPYLVLNKRMKIILSDRDIGYRSGRGGGVLLTMFRASSITDIDSSIPQKLKHFGRLISQYDSSSCSRLWIFPSYKAILLWYPN